MVISRTPHRISFFGGGTDYPDYYLKHGGKVLGVAVDKYCYLSVRRLPPFFDFTHRIVYSKMENVQEINDIQHPSVRETLKYLNVAYGVSIHHDGDIPARSGMGSSSSFTVGLLNSMYALEGQVTSRDELVKEAIHVEQDLIKENVGSQDQTFAAYGGMNVINFLQSGEIVVEPVIMKPERLHSFRERFLLFFTGLSRYASEVAGDKIKNIPKNYDNLAQMKEMVDYAYKILTTPSRDLREFGELLNETWKLKKTLSTKITKPEIDEMYDTAIKNGAIGGKLLGAGGGGFMVFYAEPRDHFKIKRALDKFLHVPFNFDFDGSKIVVYQPDRM
ncbi:MAG: kinase [Nitrospirae bacterium]|uniref:GHMP family kinase ATP-binding protein n=1 Tax=Candidatus Magnetobacterium casense TaxID=1455061 RepID=UPI00058F5836|nr:kinase [Candidatus Magnetobacterium casensis]MBF0337583.1 kinase [Nitrospirota bacterium]